MYKLIFKTSPRLGVLMFMAGFPIGHLSAKSRYTEHEFRQCFLQATGVGSRLDIDGKVLQDLSAKHALLKSME
jgi:hypothetical protein